MTPIHKSRIRKLVRALRSGKFRQTTGCLRDKKGYCCLGVASEVYRRANPTKCGWDNYSLCGGGVREDVVLPPPVQRWFGFRDSNPAVKLTRERVVEGEIRVRTRLAVIND